MNYTTNLNDSLAESNISEVMDVDKENPLVGNKFEINDKK